MDIEKVAQASMLELTDDEKKRFQKELGEIVVAFSKLDKLETDSECTFQPFSNRGKMRDDKPKESLSQERVLRDLENKEGGFIKGPRTI